MRNKKVAVIGASLGGISTAIMFAKQHNAEVTVFEKSKKISTEGAGILLYSNALLSLDQIGVYEKILNSGFPMRGKTEVVDQHNTIIGNLEYFSIDAKFPPYLGISRQLLLEILFEETHKYSIDFILNENLNIDNLNKTEFDLIVIAEGVHSENRQKLWKEKSLKKYSGFSLWHILYENDHSFKDKNLVVLPDKRFGIIPISETQMYIWASMKIERSNIQDKNQNLIFLKDSFNGCSGYLKHLIDQINLNTYVHFSPVYEVEINDVWNKNNIVLVGDAAHASLPFMAQGSAMAFADAVILSKTIDWNNLNYSLQKYYKMRKPIVDKVQNLSRKIGISYQNPTINFESVQQNLNTFYSNDLLLT
jgi:2-polyprenyl-6-methoxyphenol hydroxylase-like FAD-dependent oxidoreductase